MKQSVDLNEFTKVLADKGYSGFFLTQYAYAGTLKKSIGQYLKACENGKDNLKERLILYCYPLWEDTDSESVFCEMTVRYDQGMFRLDQMKLERKDRYGKTIKNHQIKNISLASMPVCKQAIALVSSPLKEQPAPSKKRFKM